MDSNENFIEWKEILKEKKINFILNDNHFRIILKEMGNDVDKENFIIDGKTGDRQLSNDSDEIRLNEIGAILPGSKVFIKQNIAAFSQYLVDFDK